MNSRHCFVPPLQHRDPGSRGEGALSDPHSQGRAQKDPATLEDLISPRPGSTLWTRLNQQPTLFAHRGQGWFSGLRIKEDETRPQVPPGQRPFSILGSKSCLSNSFSSCASILQAYSGVTIYKANRDFVFYLLTTHYQPMPCRQTGQAWPGTWNRAPSLPDRASYLTGQGADWHSPTLAEGPCTWARHCGGKGYVELGGNSTCCVTPSKFQPLSGP